MTSDERPPTVSEAAGWLKRNAEDLWYCWRCYELWKASMGVVAADQAVDRAPESVRKWINERAA